MGKIIRPLVCLLAIVTSLMLPAPTAAAAEQPDLQPTQIAVSNLYAGVPNTVTVTVANNGNVTATNFDVKLEANSVLVANSTGNSVLAKNDLNYWPLSVNFNWTPATAGNYTLKVIVDQANAVAESNDANNQLERSVTVNTLIPITVKVRVEGKTATT